MLGLFHLAEGSNPYIVPQFAIQLYVFVPVVSVTICIFFLAPGLLLAGAFSERINPITWVLTGFAISLGLITGVTAGAQAIFGVVLVGKAFFGLVFLLVLASLAVSVFRFRAGRHGVLDFGDAGRDLYSRSWSRGLY